MVALAMAGCEDQGPKASKAVAHGLEQMGANVRAGMPAADMVARVRKLVDDGMVCTDEHRLRAAFVLLRGGPEDLDVAASLAKASYEATASASAGRLAALAVDMAHVQRGKPQHYGVLTGTAGGKACIYSWDPSVSDEDRATLGIEPLKELLSAFEASSGYEGYLELDDLRDAKRLCDAQADVVQEVVEDVPAFQPQPTTEE
jgi:hypothetical protein